MKLSFTLLVLSFQFQSNGVNARGLCRVARSDDYKCGSARGAAPYWPATTTCGLNECCCHDDKGWNKMATYQIDTCLYQDNSVIGCFACSGDVACLGLDNTHVGDSSCNGQHACRNAGDVDKQRTIIGISSCNADFVCKYCEAGSFVPDGTCNDVNNSDEVGTLTTGYKRCRACFVSFIYFLPLN